MNVEDVIQAYKDIDKEYRGTSRALLLVLMIITLGCSTLIYQSERYALTVIVTLLLTATLGILYESLKDSERKQRLKAWGTNYVQPYLNTLPTRKEGILEVGYDLPNKDTIVYLVLSSTKLKHPIKNYTCQYNLPEDSKPYVDFKYLEQDLPFKYKKGWYQTVIYLPKDNKPKHKS